MKKSALFKMAQLAVLESCFSPADKLEILRELITHEDMARLVEEYEEKTDERI